MSVLRDLFDLEIEFHRRLRCRPPDEATSLHADYAEQFGYAHILANLEAVNIAAINGLTQQYLLPADSRDVLAARDSICRLLGLSTFEK